MLDNRVFRLVISMVSEGRIYKIVPRKGTKTFLFRFLLLFFLSIYKIVPRKGTKTTGTMHFLVTFANL